MIPTSLPVVRLDKGNAHPLDTQWPTISRSSSRHLSVLHLCVIENPHVVDHGTPNSWVSKHKGPPLSRCRVVWVESEVLPPDLLVAGDLHRPLNQN